MILKFSNKGFIYFGHGICASKSDNFIENLHLRKEELIKLILFWKQMGVSFLSLDEVHGLINNEYNCKKPWIHFTFDDGYRNNLTELLPIMEQYQIPFTVFISTGYIDTDLYLPSTSIRIALKHTQKEHSFLEGKYKVSSNMEDEERKTLAKQLVQEYKYLPSEQATTLLSEIKSLISNSEWLSLKQVYYNERMLTKEELQQLASHPLVTIASHTHTHAILHQNQSETTIDYELSTPLKWLSQSIGIRTNTLAYPNGQISDFTATVQKHMQQLGYQAAYTTVQDFVDKKTKQLAIPRFTLTDKGGWIVKLWIKDTIKSFWSAPKLF